MKLEGTYTAIVTPFAEDAAKTIDWAAFDALLDLQIEGGITGIVPCGTTGESPALTHEEQRAVIERTVKRVKGRAQVIAGAGSNSTDGAIELAKAAEAAGADAVMVVVPYYNKPSQEGLYQHYVAVAASISCPLVVYNIPARTGIDLGPETMVRLCETAKNIVAVKEATGNVLRAQDLVRRLGDRLTVLSGDDALTLPMVAVGARGVISVTSNVLPARVVQATRAALDGDRAKALRSHLALLPVHEVMFVESNPAPAKALLAMRGKIRDVVRGPLVPASEKARAAITAALELYARSSET
jgi:4-hydroxy-tetrahydrodipicolinate synthase